MASLKSWCSGLFKPVKNCFKSVKLCIKEWSEIFVGWFFLGFIPGLLAVFKFIKMVGIKGLTFDVALPLVDFATDSKFVYDMHQADQFYQFVKMNHKLKTIRYEKNYNSTSWNDEWSCTDHIANKSFTPSFVMGTPMITLSMNVTCIELSSGLSYKLIDIADTEVNKGLTAIISGITALSKILRV